MKLTCYLHVTCLFIVPNSNGCLGQPKASAKLLEAPTAPTRAPVAGTTLEGKASVACVPCCCHPCLVQSWKLSETRFTEAKRNSANFVAKRSEAKRNSSAHN